MQLTKQQKLERARIIRITARTVLLVLGIPLLLFSMVSGSAEYGGGFSGIISNMPNAMPWLLLIILISVAWKRELGGGIAIAIFGLAMIVFFCTREGAPYTFVLVLNFLISICGGLLIYSWSLSHEKSDPYKVP